MITEAEKRAIRLRWGGKQLCSTWETECEYLTHSSGKEEWQCTLLPGMVIEYGFYKPRFCPLCPLNKTGNQYP